MDVFVYFFEPLKSGLDEIEDAIDEALQGRGKVTGTGTGKSGSNVDIELADDVEQEVVLGILRKAFENLEIPNSTKIKIEGKEYKLS